MIKVGLTGGIGAGGELFVKSVYLYVWKQQIYIY